nr:reverse transcriptase domain, reverse transcriptase zinc-binding domain protein [Tanacetum cinerariifolium]
VLVEVDARKEYLEKIKINYVDAMKKVKLTKWVKVEYSWKPDRCKHCKVFGHTVNYCKAKQVNGKSEANQEASANGNQADNEGFVEVKNKKKNNGNARYVVKQKALEQKSKERENNSNPDKGKLSVETNGDKRVEEVNDEELGDNVCQDDRLIVDRYILMKSKPPPKEMMKWTYDMKLYVKYRWDAVNRENKNSDEEDIIEEVNATKDLKFQAAHGVFLPYMVSDHSPVVLHIKNEFPKKKSSFRFCNFMVDKTKFLNLVNEACNKDIHGCHMYQLVKKLKKLKRPLKKLSWSNGRHIQDNILIAQELLRGYNKKNGPKRCAMKIDIQKAYDTVSWSFLEDILGKFRFYRKMITWIMTCVKSTSFSIFLNGDMHGFFKGGRDLRQGDPISPYLFTLVTEVFSLIMDKNIEESSRFGYHFGCNELKLSHMCFDDDLLVLCKGNKESIKVIKKSLGRFSQVSDLIPNLGKSIIFFESINERDKIDLLQVLPFKCGKLLVRYLEVPLLAKKLRVSDCKVICDKVKGRINNSRNKTLSYAGRIQLIAYVLSSIHQFLWNAGDSAKGKARVSWKVPDGWRENFTILSNLSSTVNLVNKYDKVLWATNAGDRVKFDTKHAWEDLRVNWPIVNWSNVVWFNQLVPRHAFILWMVV